MVCAILGSDEEAEDYNNAEVHQDMIARMAADHGVEGDSIPQTPQQKEEARGNYPKPFPLVLSFCSDFTSMFTAV